MQTLFEKLFNSMIESDSELIPRSLLRGQRANMKIITPYDKIPRSSAAGFFIKNIFYRCLDKNNNETINEGTLWYRKISFLTTSAFLKYIFRINVTLRRTDERR
jgi:hypothetical protein